ncbi:MAG: hypothetical protein K2P55_08450 [Bacteroides acidifaciens]|uniref:hypothetical protein n=1 Tax=Bacteroides acidifaciens TaxID=85831 RepID=UPI0023D40E95|nr:hypothetical protein [Bacteroides acidifaciens]MDE6819989.1 hypothetical protein [Bacteroides acidifaciens]MDE6986943.1 hypothetical protein [Bacteroides acidifaciens]
MNLNFKKKVLCFGAIIFIAGMSVAISSCSSDEDGSDNRTKNALMDSVAESDEFIDFVDMSEVLSKKTLSYTSTLSQEEFDELVYNLNNDDYMEEFVTKANIKNEISAITKAKEKLLNNTDFFNLNETERTKLFLETAKRNSSIMLKTRSEVTSNECDQRRAQDYAWARAQADIALIGCTCLWEMPIAACACYALAMANYANDIRLADRAYEDCMRSIH